jgi:hypothetical protein
MKYRFVWAMEGVGFLVALCIVEAGGRESHGNFLWSYSICIFISMVYTYVKWMDVLVKKKGRMLYKIAFGASGAVFIYQIWCGVYFFIRLLQGDTYWMLK